MTADGPLYAKFQVERTDRSPRHPDCRYFVLDFDHDPHAAPALRAYAAACEATHPQLAASLRAALAGEDA